METDATIRQKQVFHDVVNGSTISGAMVKHGYSPSTAKRTNKITSTKGWQKLVQKHLSDEKLAKVHSEGLAATKYESRLIGKGESEIVEVPDFAVRHKYLDTGYKVKKVYSDAPTNNTAILVQISEAIAKKNGL